MSRRRFARSRTKPDMGWIVGTSAVQVTGPSPGTNIDFLFDFADIDPEATTGRVEADKSDWFIKRVIADLHTTADLPGFDQNDCVRIIQWGLSTVGVENANQVNTAPISVFSGEWFNLQSRILRTGTIPAYHFGQIPIAVANPSNYIAVETVSAGDPGDSDPAGYANQTPWFGSGRKELDFEVSNAGLRNNQGLCLTICTYGLQGLPWASEDTAYVHIAYRVLMQKRR